VLCFKSPARSKRRLAREIGELASAAADHLWDCALEDLRAWPGPACFAPASTADLAWLTEKLGEQPEVALQRGANLGERINHVDRALRARGATKVIYIGTDCPAMGAAYLSQAADTLENSDAVLGPARDGGVVLMGARRPWPMLEDLPWSTDELYGTLSARCAQHAWSISSLEPRADVDTAADLLGTRMDLMHDHRTARRALAGWVTQKSRSLGDGS